MVAELLAEFASAEALLRARGACEAKGIEVRETFSPWPLDPLPPERARPDAIALASFAGGALGALVGYGVQWWTTAIDYPLDVGGRPLHSAPAFVPATFEATILGAAALALVAFFLRSGLPRLWHPLFEVESFGRAAVDRFFLLVTAPDREAAIRILLDAGALQICEPEEPP